MAGRDPRRRLSDLELRRRIDDSLSEAASLAAPNDRGECPSSLGLAVDEIEAAAMDLAEVRRRLRWAESRCLRIAKLITRIRRRMAHDKLRIELARKLMRIESGLLQ
jgi:hypothetical protein